MMNDEEKNHACKSAINLASDVWLFVCRLPETPSASDVLESDKNLVPVSFLSFLKVKTSLGTNGADKAYPYQCLTRTQILVLRYKDTTQI